MSVDGGPVRRTSAALVTLALGASIVLTTIALIALGRVTNEEEPSPAALRAEDAEIPRADGSETLAARMWLRDPARIALLLHGFGADQTEWDEAIDPLLGAVDHPMSVLTFDFRGHGESPGENRDFDGMVVDVESAIAYARSRGFEEVVLIGASMGGAAAIIAAADDPGIVAVFAISAPSELGGLDAVAAASALDAPLELLVAAEDPSGVESFQELREEAVDATTSAVMYPGNAHGAALAESADVQDRMARKLNEIFEAN